MDLMSSKRALAYRRRSPRPEEDFGNTSLEKQKDEIIKYCERNNIELVDIYTDDLKSGKSFEGSDYGHPNVPPLPLFLPRSDKKFTTNRQLIYHSKPFV